MVSKVSSKWRVRSAAVLLGSIGAVLTALPATADGPPARTDRTGKPSGIACQQAGISTLQSLDLLSAVAKGGIEVVGIGVLDFKTVLRLHRTNPELFDGGDSAVTVVVPGMGEVLASWCE